jgi:hypothetical protein
MKRIIPIFTLGFLLGILGKNLYHSFLTGLNPVIVFILLIILASCFLFEIIYLHKNSVKRSVIFLAFVINSLFIGGFIYLDVQQIQGKNKNYFSFIAYY